MQKKNPQAGNSYSSFYNSEQKLAFMASGRQKAKPGKLIRLFDAFAPYEELWGFDLVLQGIEPLQNAFDQITGEFSEAGRVEALTVLMAYREWYLETSGKKDPCEGILLLNAEQAEDVRRKYVASQQHLRMVLDEVYDDPSENTLDCVFRGYFWLAFIGVPSSEIISITMDEVDFYTMQIHHKGIDYKLPQEGVAEFHKLCELTHFRSVHRNPDYEHIKTRISGDELLRGSAKVSLGKQYLNDSACRKIVRSDYKLDFGDVFASGLFCRLFEFERLGRPIEFKGDVTKSDVVKHNAGAAPYKYKSRYMEWKEAFVLIR